MSGAARIVVNGRFLAQVQTGVQRYARETLLALDALLQARPRWRDELDVTLAVPPGTPLPALSAIRAVEVPGGGGHLWEQLALWRHARDAFLVNFSYSGPLFKRRQLVTIHDATVRAMPQGFSRRYRLLHNAMVAILGRSAQSVMTVSEFSRDELARRFGLRRTDIVVGREGGEHATRGAGADDDAAVMHATGSTPVPTHSAWAASSRTRTTRWSGAHCAFCPTTRGRWRLRALKTSASSATPTPATKVFAFSASSPTRIWARCTATRRALCCLRCTKASGCRRWRRWPTIARCWRRARPRCPRSAATLRCTSIRTTRLRWQALRQFAAEPALRARMVAAGRARLARYHWRANAQILLEDLLTRVSGAPAAAASAGPSGQGQA